MEFEITPPEGTTFGPVTTNFRPVAVSPDGRLLAMIAGPRDGKPMLWIRPLASNTPRPIAGTENAAHPFWSPDGKWVGFLAGGTIKRVDVSGGPSQTLGETNRPGGAFNSAGVMLLTRTGQPLLRAASTGGTTAPLFALDAGLQETGEYDPVFLPDGNHLLYIKTGPQMGVVFASLDGSVRKFLFAQQNSPADFAPDGAANFGWLLYQVRGQLIARRFNPSTGDVAGEPAPIADNVVAGPTFSASSTGVLTFRRGTQVKRQLVWFSRDGTRQGTIGEIGTGLGSPRIAPDGTSVLLSRAVDGNTDIWLESTRGGAATRLTFEAGSDNSPVWSPDGQRLYYASVRDGAFVVIERPANGLAADQVRLKNERGLGAQPLAVSRDGRWLVVRKGSAGQSALSFLSLADGRAIDFPETGSVVNASLSPDGRWIAYDMGADRSTLEVFVRGVPKDVNGSSVDAKRQLSSGAGSSPVWRADGKEIFYLAPDGTVMSVPVETGEGVFRTGTPHAMFKAGEGALFDVTADGQRFLVSQVTSEADPPVTVIVNWPKLLKK